MAWHDTLIRKLQEHTELSKTDLATIKQLPGITRHLQKNEDILRQGDKPTDSTVVLEGFIARYHTVSSGRRQYLSFHMPGDMPDAQTLFLETMDFSLCAMEKSVIALVPHAAIINLFKERPETGTAFWKETLIDAAIFREAITNNSSRNLLMRLAHFFCEQYYRAHKSGLTEQDTFKIPLTQTQLGEALASSLPSISRAMSELRKTNTVEFDNGVLQVKDWKKLVQIGDFNPTYLHLKKSASI